MSLRYFDDEDMTRDQQNQNANDFMESAIDGNNSAIYREVF